MIEVLTKQIYRCTCEWKDCEHQWDAPATDDSGNTIDPPARCSKCKRYTWNGRDPEDSRPRRIKDAPKPKALPIPKPKRRKSAR